MKSLEELFGAPAKKEATERREIFAPLLAKAIEAANTKEVPQAEEAVFRASGLGYCGRFIIYKLRGYTDKKTAQEALTLEFGTAIHEILQRYISGMKEFVTMEEEVSIEGINNTNGHFDGILNIGKKRYLLEIKSSNVEAFQRLSLRPIPYDAHKKQANFYMKALDIEETIFLYVNKNGKLLADFERANPDVNPLFLEILYKREEKLHEENKNFVEYLTKCYKDGIMPEYKRVSQCTWCNFADQCKEDRKTERKAKKALGNEQV